MDNQHHLTKVFFELREECFFINRDIRNAFFIGIEGLNYKTIDQVLEQVKHMEEINSAFSLEDFYRRFIFEDDKRINLLENDIKYMIRVEYTKFLLHHHIEQYLLSEDEIKQLSTLVKRNDFKGKIITKLLNKVDTFLVKHCEAMDDQTFLPKFIYGHIYKVLFYSFSTAYEKMLQEHTNKNYSNLFEFLKKIKPSFSLEDFLQMNNVVSNQIERGIDVYTSGFERYLESKGIKNPNNMNWTIESYGLGNLDLLSEIFKDMNLTKDNQQGFFPKLINYLYQKNETIMANQIIDIVLSGYIQKFNITKHIDKPLVFYSEKQCDLLAKHIVNEIIKLDGKKNEQKALILYPLYNEHHEPVSELGRTVFESFISNLFGNHSDMFFKIFDNPDAIIRNEEVYENMTKFELRSRNYYDLLRSLWRGSSKSEVLLELNPLFYDDVYAKERFYVTIGVMTNLGKPVENILFDSLTQLFQLVAHRYNLKLNDAFFIDDRSEKEQNLMNLLDRFGIHPNNKEDYLASIIDNEVATIEQMDRFPVIEQVGDAIYELCISEFLLRDLDMENPGQFSNKEIEFVKAPFQVEIAEKIGLDTCYIHNKFLEDKFKMDYFDKVITDAMDTSNHYDKKTYLADALEMLIGSIYFDQGIEVAIEFTKSILTQNNDYLKNLSEVVIPSHERRFNLDWNEYELYTRIYPQLNMFYSGQYVIQEPLGYSLSKLLSILVYGNETKQKRSELRQISYRRQVSITSRVGSNLYLAYNYLNEGFDKARSVYEQEVLPKILEEVHFEN